MNIINNEQDLMELVPVLQDVPRIGLDVEATGLDPYTSRLLLIQLSTEQEIFIINAGRVKNETLRYLFRLIKDSDIEVVSHNLKYEMKMVYHNFSILLTMLLKVVVSRPISSWAAMGRS